MPTHTIALVLAKKAVMYRGSKAAAKKVVMYGGSKAMQAAQSKSVKTATDMVVDAVVMPVADEVTGALTRPFAYFKNRSLAVQLARQIGGTPHRVIIAGDRYWLVRLDKTPFEVFPPLPKDLGPLAECRELQNYQGDRKDPSADSS